MKAYTWDTPNKMHFESDHTTFNRQTKYISVGNVIADTQYSSYIRPYTETECGSMQFAPGHLQHYDLQGFDGFNLGSRLMDYIATCTHDHGGILYVFFHRSRKRTIVDGIVLTTRDCKHVETWYMPGHSAKSYSAVEAAKAYILAEE